MRQIQGVQIRGDGIAACCCVHLLRKHGFEVTHERTDRARLPAIMLSDAALALIRDVFDRPGLFRDLPVIRKRVVSWGSHADPILLKHSAFVVSEEQLLAAVREETPNLSSDTPAWTVFTSRPLPPDSEEQSFGSRIARATPVTLNGETATCWIESLSGGWLFLIPNSISTGWLLSVGAADLEESRLIAPQICDVQAPAGEFAAFPRMMTPLCGPGWLSCGSAAMAFDPVCGDGTANAVREAILAAAVIQAASTGGDQDGLFRHYQARLMAGFQRHLAMSISFYESGGSGEWWQEELNALRRGLAWCGKPAEFHYRLNGFALELR
jgi:hypothetical protein